MLVGVAVEYAVEIEGDVVPGEGVLVRHAQAIAFARLEVAAAAPDAPDEYHNIACVVLAGYLYDAPPSEARQTPGRTAAPRSSCAAG